MELHIRFAVPRGGEQHSAAGQPAERQEFPADRLALDAAGFPQAEELQPADGGAAELRPGLL
eukprot:13007824-Alexandrium_andersonii.AAC.1